MTKNICLNSWKKPINIRLLIIRTLRVEIQVKEYVHDKMY